MLCKLHSVYKIIHCIHCVILHRGSQIVIQQKANFSRSIWKKIHRAEKIYTVTVCGVCDKYEVCVFIGHELFFAHCNYGNHTKNQPNSSKPMQVNVTVFYLDYLVVANSIELLRFGTIVIDFFYAFVTRTLTRL